MKDLENKSTEDLIEELRLNEEEIEVLCSNNRAIENELYYRKHPEIRPKKGI